MEYCVHESYKQGFNTKESYIVTRGRTSFLRVVGEQPNYEMMTATASEDGNDFVVCQERARLISAALRLASEIGVNPVPRKDRAGREFLGICTVKLESNDSFAEVDAALVRFFQLYDEVSSPSEAGTDEMREIYNHLAVDDSMNEIYLSDGVWLSSDGALHDRGR